MDKIYVVTGSGMPYAYTNKEDAEMRKEMINYNLGMSGSWDRASINEIPLHTEMDQKDIDFFNTVVKPTIRKTDDSISETLIDMIED